MHLGSTYDQRTFVNPEKKISGSRFGRSILLKKLIALNEGRLELNARVEIRAKDFNEWRISV
jgi:hypothetical protein